MARIYLKGQDEPQVVDENKAKQIKEAWMDKNTPRNSVIDFGSWSTTFADIKRIFLDGEKKIESGKIYQPHELQQLENEFTQLKKDNPNLSPVQLKLKLMENKMAIKITNLEARAYSVYPDVYKNWCELEKQWGEWRFKKQYAEKKMLEELETDRKINQSLLEAKMQGTFDGN